MERQKDVVLNLRTIQKKVSSLHSSLKKLHTEGRAQVPGTGVSASTEPPLGNDTAIWH